jgi:predicted Zn-dependent protease
VAVVPVGKVPAEEVEAALVRAGRVLRRTIELKAALPLPQGVEERERGQFRAGVLMARLRSTFSQLGPGRMVGEGATQDKPAVRPDAIVFVTDADLFTANSDSVFAAILASQRLGIASLRRMREAFYRRPADPGKQRARLAKELIRMIARLSGAPECSTIDCVLAPTNMLADLDLKQEKLCRACSQRMFQGTVRL